MMKKIIVAIIIIMIGASSFLIFKPKQTIKIGFSGDISSAISSLSVEARDAVQLRINEINDLGGIDGHPLELVVLDDSNDANTFENNVNTFKDKNIKYMLGPITSNLASATKAMADEGIIIMSGSVSSDILVDIDDYFFRTTPSVKVQSDYLAQHLSEEGDMPSVSIVYDIRNESYVNEFRLNFEDVYKGQIVKEYMIGSEDCICEEDIVKDLEENPADVLIILASSIQTANIAQYIDLYEVDIEKIGVPWSMTNDLITSGGSAVEDMKFVYLDYENYSPHTDPEFVKLYKEAYKIEPSFISGFYYEATAFLLEAIAEADSFEIEDVKASLISIQYDIAGDSIQLNQYGDRDQSYTMYVLKNGAFIPCYLCAE